MPNAVITGASKGIGKAIATLFAQKGFNLCICSRNEKNLAALANELEQVHPHATIIYKKCDVAVKEEVIELGKFAAKHFDKIDVLVNNAGVFLGGAMHQEADEQFETMMHTNVFSTYYVTKNILPLMLPHKSGYIFNICSIASFMAYAHGGSYSVSKFAMLGFSKSLREEMKPYNIKVTAVMPGATYTDSWNGVAIPEQRMMPAEDIAQMIYQTFTLSDRTVVEDIVLRPQLGDL